MPAIRGVKRIAKNLEQKSLFHAYDIGLGLYKGDFGDYPESKIEENGGKVYCGAQHLAEAMVGRDDKGFEPSQNKRWYWPGYDTAVNGLYFSSDPADPRYTKSMNRRKKPYVNLKETGAFVMDELYDSPYAGNVVSQEEPLDGEIYRAPVLTDVFMTKKIELANGERIKVGSPILYYKANSASKLFKKVPAASDGPAEFETWIYNYEDNRQLIDSGLIEPDDPAGHPAGYLALSAVLPPVEYFDRLRIS